MTSLDEFRLQTRHWLESNCPRSMRTRMVPGEQVTGGQKRRSSNPDSYLWLDRMVEKGWTVPTWPAEYGGGGLKKDQFLILLQELQRIQARPPLGGMGVDMIGPTLLEFGTNSQKARHLPAIARGETAWCQGYSEPGAGSDLASLTTKAEPDGDRYLVNGSKIWTSGAQTADWIFCLVRTDSSAPKHKGISFVLFPMDQEGVAVKPINMINGHSPFCETFFHNAVAKKEDLVHEENHGWTVAKRLLQYERSSLSSLANADTAGALERIKPSVSLPKLALEYEGKEKNICSTLRSRILKNELQREAYLLTQRRAVEEEEAQAPGSTSSIFKYVEADYVKEQLEIQLAIRGFSGIGWEGHGFSNEEISMGRLWLEAKSISIAGGSNEIQLNIIAKRVLGLPD